MISFKMVGGNDRLESKCSARHRLYSLGVHQFDETLSKTEHLQTHSWIHCAKTALLNFMWYIAGTSKLEGNLLLCLFLVEQHSGSSSHPSARNGFTQRGSKRYCSSHLVQTGRPLLVASGDPASIRPARISGSVFYEDVRHNDHLSRAADRNTLRGTNGCGIGNWAGKSTRCHLLGAKPFEASGLLTEWSTVADAYQMRKAVTHLRQPR